MTSKLKTNLIKSTLDISTTQLTPATLEKLRISRAYALEHQRTSRTVPVLAWLNGNHTLHNSSHLHKTIHWAVAAMFAAILISGASIWHDYTSEHEISEVDISILTDDLPLNVYLD
jgi:hypothetical protein